MPYIQHQLPQGPKLNLGCGPVQPKGWVNIDGSNRAWLASKLPLVDNALVKLHLLPATEYSPEIKYHNLSRGIPFPDNSVSCIYAGELWEHFEYEGASKITGDCYRALGQNGVLRVCVPDGVNFWKRYLNTYDGIMEKPRHSRSAKPLIELVQMYFKDICTKKMWLASMGHTHKWQFDQIQLIALLESNGFSQVERMPFHESRIPDIESIERSDFLIVEGIKSA
ncbi:hypothetical protein ACFL9T_06985 [Thermodesulfobacteriota bacterium]